MDISFLAAPTPQAVQCGEVIDAMMQKRLEEESAAQATRWLWTIGLLVAGGFFFTRTKTGKNLAKNLFSKA